MEATQQEQQNVINKVYDYAAHLLIKEDKGPAVVKKILVDEGVNLELASAIVDKLQSQIEAAKKERAQKDMLYGALWCIGGTILTVADIGFIFWGAILFGAVQFFKGVANL
ncbi:hypothetical protein V6R21_07185 [Limibacter armeniacum]|uniref:hypothetical protein n=1 Tax=Limibacter armeniacum TaxID=466084 RepID=UPI002FE5380D